MIRYEKYKPSGIEWIGEIPEHWDYIMIKRLSPVKRGASPRPIDNPIYFDENREFAWVRIADVSASERYLENTTQILSELGASLSVKRKPGDFFLSIAGTVGKPIITKIKCCIHDGFVYFSDLTIDPEYLFYIFSTGMPYKGLGKLGTQLNLNTDTVGEIVIPSEQEIKGLVIFLDRKTAEIDQIIANKQNLIALYEEEKQAVINHAVTHGVDRKVRLKPSGVEWLGDIPEHWKVKRLKYLSQIISKGTTPSTIGREILLNGPVRFIKAENVVDRKVLEIPENFIDEETNRIINRSQLEKNDLLFVIAVLLLVK